MSTRIQAGLASDSPGGALIGVGIVSQMMQRGRIGLQLCQHLAKQLAGAFHLAGIGRDDEQVGRLDQADAGEHPRMCVVRRCISEMKQTVWPLPRGFDAPHPSGTARTADSSSATSEARAVSLCGSVQFIRLAKMA